MDIDNDLKITLIKKDGAYMPARGGLLMTCPFQFPTIGTGTIGQAARQPVACSSACARFFIVPTTEEDKANGDYVILQNCGQGSQIMIKKEDIAEGPDGSKKPIMTIK